MQDPGVDIAFSSTGTIGAVVLATGLVQVVLRLEDVTLGTRATSLESICSGDSRRCFTAATVVVLESCQRANKT